MKVLVIGSGGREHALVWKLSQSPHVSKVFCAPGNAGTALTSKCTNMPIKADDIEALVGFATRERPDLTVVGPEVPLCSGIVNRWPESLAIFGPDCAMAQLEGSKIAAKMVMQRLNIPTASWSVFENSDEAIAWLECNDDNPRVVKADGLAAGKGVIVCANRAEAIAAVGRVMADREFGEAGNKIIIEDCLVGVEFSLLAICDGKSFVLLKAAKDHKPALDGDLGENTGGMGCYCPAPHLSPELIADVAARGIAPIVAELSYRGVIYLGGMLMPDGSWYVLEYNCRFGDPETQVILPLLKNDLFDLLLSACNGQLPDELDWYTGVCVSVVMASGGYPGAYEKGKIIYGLDGVPIPGEIVFHAGTAFDPEDRIISAGGRVLNVGATAPTFTDACAIAYIAVGDIRFDGATYRSDIAEGLV